MDGTPSIAGLLLDSLGDTPTPAAVSDAINRLAELFHCLTKPPRKEIQGLWAELFVIARSDSPVAMARCWHAEPNDAFDFSVEAERIEVKSASGSSRQHVFSLQQLRPAQSVSVFVVSVLVQRTSSGESVNSLLRLLRNRLGGNLKAMLLLERMVAETLGEKWRESDIAFDAALAEESIRVYSALSIPSVNPDLPPEVSDVRFRVDMSRLEPVRQLDDTAILRMLRGSGAWFHRHPS
jgi:hypothetical protein